MQPQPPEYYELFGLDPQAPPSARSGVPSPLMSNRETWEGLAAVIDFQGGRPAEVRLLPLDLGFGEPRETRGIPRLAGAGLAQTIIERVARRSRGYRTRIRYSREEGCGIVQLPG
jgi:hypothetical protein